MGSPQRPPAPVPYFGVFIMVAIGTGLIIGLGTVLILALASLDNLYRWLMANPVRWWLVVLSIWVLGATNIMYIHQRKSYKQSLKEFNEATGG